MMNAADGTNLLIHEKSPYLLQHAKNPVDWHPWGEEAFQKATDDDKPVFLSVGYATCHWCHVMAHESFEDSETARILNDHFVSVKVDREERPDLDKLYMSVCQALTGHGGWPLSVFLTPEKIPFFAGTYFPKVARQGLIGFPELLLKLNTLWKEDRERLLTAGAQITEHLQKASRAPSSGTSPGADMLDKASVALASGFDAQWGGFGGAPKFPSPHQLTFLLRRHQRSGAANDLQMVEKTLQSMRWGGLFDHMGYGFHRYSVDEKWFAPHFEKMLYDQALLTMAYTEAYQVTGRSFYARVAREILTYVLRDMTSSEGGFYSAEDADSEGVEGLFYLWTPGQVREVLGPETGDLICDFFDIREGGNFEEDRSIPHMRMSLSAFAKEKGMGEKELTAILQEGREKLFAARKKRIAPLKDDKILTAWNGLMITAFLKAYRVLGNTEYLRAAEKAIAFILDTLRDGNGYLIRRYRDGEAAHAGYLDDYAFFSWALTEAYETTFDAIHLEHALEVTRSMLSLFWDAENGGFFFTGGENETLIAPSRDAQDGAVPSGNSIAALTLLQLGRLTGETAFEERADLLMRSFSEHLDAYPSAHTQLLQALDFMIGPAQEVVIAGPRHDPATEAMLAVIHRNFLPRTVSLLVSGEKERDRLSELAPFVREMVPVDGKTTAYVCRQYACQAPVTDPGEMEKLLKQ